MIPIYKSTKRAINLLSRPTLQVFAAASMYGGRNTMTNILSAGSAEVNFDISEPQTMKSAKTFFFSHAHPNLENNVT